VMLLSKAFKHGDFGIANCEVQVISWFYHGQMYGEEKRTTWQQKGRWSTEQIYKSARCKIWPLKRTRGRFGQGQMKGCSRQWLWHQDKLQYPNCTIWDLNICSWGVGEPTGGVSFVKRRFYPSNIWVLP
jgi:hypothetical protein